VPVKLIHAAENQVYKQAILQNLQGFAGVAPQRMAVDEITRQTVEFKRRFQNLHIAAVYSMLANGKIWMKSDGTFCSAARGAGVTIDFAVPTGQNGAGSVVIPGGSSWASASNPIVQQVNGLKRLAIQTTGYPLKNAYYGRKIPDYLLTNNETSNLIIRNPAYNARFLDTGTIPNGFLDLNWIPMQDAFAEDNTGTVCRRSSATTRSRLRRRSARNGTSAERIVCATGKHRRHGGGCREHFAADEPGVRPGKLCNTDDGSRRH